MRGCGRSCDWSKATRMLCGEIARLRMLASLNGGLPALMKVAVEERRLVVLHVRRLSGALFAGFGHIFSLRGGVGVRRLTSISLLRFADLAANGIELRRRRERLRNDAHKRPRRRSVSSRRR